MTNAATLNLARPLDSISRNLALNADEVARIVGASARTIRRWAAGASLPHRQSKERLLELVAVGEALSEVIRPEDANLWLFTPNPLLGYDKPSDRIAQGQWRDVIGVIEAMADGVAV